MKLEVLLACLLFACACGPAPAAQQPSKDQKTNVGTANPTLESAAKELDPGPVEALGPRYPPTFRALLEKATQPGNKLAAARDLVARLERAQERGRGRIDDGMLAN